MKIDRHNYEEFFILYMDNELNAEQRAMVESFVAQHPDLKEELDSLLQYKLIPDTNIQFPLKEDLWKGDATLHAGNRSEWLLSYVDNELTPAQRKLVEEHIIQDKDAAAELDLLLRTKLVAEPISFPDKSGLYRREERRIPLFWIRIAAAVIIAAIGITVFSVLSRNNNNSADLPVASNDTRKNPVSEQPGKAGQPPIKKEETNSTEPGEELVVVPVNNREKKEGKEIQATRERPVLPNEKEAPVASNEIKETRTNNLPAPVNNPSLRPDDKAIASNNISEEFKDPNKLLRNTDVTTRTDQPSDIRTAANNPDEQEIPEQGRSGKKNKLRGFFRTISRTFEKRTNMDPTEDNKLLVAGFSINLK